jgi:Rod binding domain-containing protein
MQGQGSAMTAIAGLHGADRAITEQHHVDPRLARAAHEFEAQMMKELLAPMTRSNALVRESDQEDSGILGDFACESLAGALSAGGGLGIADRIIHSLSGSANSPFTGNHLGIGNDK